jgi:excisionase family DNA binding protein
LTKTIINSDELDKLISQAEAARFRGVSKQAIANLISRGRLKTVTVAGRILLYRSEVEAFAAQPKLGRPPKKRMPGKTTKKSGT